MFDSLAGLSGKLAATGYFIDPVMTQVVFLAGSSRSRCCSKAQPAQAKLN